jgi:hypothetical protein
LSDAGFVVCDIQMQAAYSNGMAACDVARLVIDEDDFLGGQIEGFQG